MLKNEAVLILDFGGQYSQLIARRVRDCNVYCEIKSCKTPAHQIAEAGYKGIIFSGGPNSVYTKDAPVCDKAIFTLGIPVLGICYGAQLMAHLLGGTVSRSEVREYGKTPIRVQANAALFHNLPAESVCWMSHTDYIAQPPAGFAVTAESDACPVAAMADDIRRLYAFQFHPEVEHTVYGTEMLKNFLYDVCGCSGSWKMDSFAEETIRHIREKVGGKRVLCALSGGVDSSVAAVLVH